MILTPVYCSSEPPPASGPVRSKMTPILIFFSWAWAETAIPSVAAATISPPITRAALPTSIEPSLENCALHFLILLAPITGGAPTDVKRPTCLTTRHYAERLTSARARVAHARGHAQNRGRSGKRRNRRTDRADPSLTCRT